MNEGTIKQFLLWLVDRQIIVYSKRKKGFMIDKQLNEIMMEEIDKAKSVKIGVMNFLGERLPDVTTKDLGNYHEAFLFMLKGQGKTWKALIENES